MSERFNFITRLIVVIIKYILFDNLELNTFGTHHLLLIILTYF